MYLFLTLIGCFTFGYSYGASHKHTPTHHHTAKVKEQNYEMEVLSESPRIVLYRNFLSSAECDQMVKDATPHLQRSMVVNPVSTDSKVDEARTSEGMFFPGRGSNSLIADVEKRIAQLTNTPVEHGESIQVLHYGPGAEYKPHYDYFDPSTVGGAAAYNRGGQRVMTFIMYLHDTEEGGETIFPKANVAVKPIKGNAVLFYNCLPDGIEDNLTLHGGAPVGKGEKWIATKWIRKGVFH